MRACIRAALLLTALCQVSCQRHAFGHKEPSCAGPESSGWAVPVGEGGILKGASERVRRIRDGAEMVLVRLDPTASAHVSKSSTIEGAGDYYIDAHEVTNAQYSAFVAATNHPDHSSAHEWEVLGYGGGPGRATGVTWHSSIPAAGTAAPSAWDRLPVVLVTWDDAHAYAEWVGCDLPTADQWERAASPDEHSWTFMWGNEMIPTGLVGNLPDESHSKMFGNEYSANRALGWILFGYEDGFPGLAPVCSFPPNARDVYDLEGNVAEWCSDPDPTDAESRVVKGGAWRMETPDMLRLGNQETMWKGALSDNVGFRCARRIARR